MLCFHDWEMKTGEPAFDALFSPEDSKFLEENNTFFLRRMIISGCHRTLAMLKGAIQHRSSPLLDRLLRLINPLAVESERTEQGRGTGEQRPPKRCL